MSIPPTHRRRQPAPPVMESLEDRLLLTTLTIADEGVDQIFLYRNSMNAVCRITLHGSIGDSVELMSYSFTGAPSVPVDGEPPPDQPSLELVDLVGLKRDSTNIDRNFDPTEDTPDIVTWPEGSPGDIIRVSTDGTSVEWRNYQATGTDASRGSNTELFAIYVAQASADTVLTLTTLDSTELMRDSGPYTQFIDINPWESTPQILFATGGTDHSAPAGSGGTIVGALQSPSSTKYYRYEATTDALVNAKAVPIGIYPGMDGTGEPLYPGITISPDVEEMGRIMVAGVLSGEVMNGSAPQTSSSGGNIETIYAGFLWGNISVGGNLGDVVLRNGGGALVYDNGGTLVTQTPDSGSLIYAGRSITSVSNINPGLPFFSSVQAGFHQKNDPGSRLYELETASENWSDAMLDEAWLKGQMVDVNNDTMQHAQFLSHPTGNFTLEGSLWYDVRHAEPLIGTLTNYQTDWYALPLMAGQTTVIEGWSNDGSLRVLLFDAKGRWLDSFGYESIEDEDIGSGGSTPKPMTFTAPAAGIYYLCVFGGVAGSVYDDYDYSLAFTNATRAALGGINVAGDYDGRESNATGEAAGYNIVSENAGGIGGVLIWDRMYGASVWSKGNGDLVAVQAGTMGLEIFSDGTLSYSTLDIASDGNVGSVATMLDIMNTHVRAGASDGRFNNNAYIQNIYGFTDYMGGDITASGSIGVIQFLGSFGLDELRRFSRSSSITVNSDSRGPAGRVDLIDVGSNWWAPTLRHGPGGDFGYLNIGGTIYTIMRGLTQPLEETVWNDGNARTLLDDGGGRVTITLLPTQTYDAAGLPVVDAFLGPVTYMPTASYAYVPVDDGAGGIIANLRFNGSANINVGSDKAVDIGRLDLTPVDDAYDSGDLLDTAVITITGDKKVNIYNIELFGEENDRPQIWFHNRTPGDLVCGLLIADVVDMDIGGCLGALGGVTGAWIPGSHAAPFVPEGTNPLILDGTEIEPQYGWFNGTVNGLWVEGALETLDVGGSVGDVRVTGAVGTIRANADGVTRLGKWDGVNGIIWSAVSIENVNVGDGLADDGGSMTARAAIMSSGYIREVRIDVPYYEISVSPGANINDRLRGSVIFGQLNGSIIGVYDQQVTTTNQFGETVEELVPAVGRVIGTNGARCTALILATSLEQFRAFDTSVIVTGGVGIVDFSGPGSEISGTGLHAHYLRTMRTSSDSNGISFSTLRLIGGYQVGQPIIGLISAGGPGMSNVTVTANGADIGTIEAVGPEADILYCKFTGTDGLRNLSARHFQDNDLSFPGTVGSVAIRGDFFGSQFGSQDVGVGAINKMTVAGDFRDNDLRVAGLIGSMVIGGDYDNSQLVLNGPSTAYLKYLQVGGDISGWITSAGRIGRILAPNGVISAVIETLSNDTNSDVEEILVGRGYTGSLTVAGSLLKFTSYVSLGENPEDTGSGASQTFNVWKNLKLLRVGNNSGAAHLYANFNVGGDIGTIDVDGTLYGNITVNGNFDKLILDGALGGRLDLDDDGIDEDSGSLTVYGAINSIKFNTALDLVADLTVGGSLMGLSLANASIVGNLASRYGSIGNIKLVGGSISGNITGKSVGKIDVTNGNITGDITATDGNIAAVVVNGGNLAAGVTAEGTIDVLNIVGGVLAGHTISAGRGIGKASVSGELAANVVSGRGIASLTAGSISGRVSAETTIDKLVIAGALTGSVRGADGVTQLTAGSMSGATISSAGSLGKLKIIGGVDDSFILAGYDIGANGAVGGGDDNPITGAVHSGNIVSLDIGGVLNGTIIAAGVGPGGLGGWAYAAFLSAGDNTEADGVSSILKLTVKGGYGADASAVLADTAIDAKWLATSHPTVTVDYGVSSVLSGSGTDFGPGTANGPTLVVGGLTLSLTGDGVANYNPTTRTLVLERTSSKSKLVLSGTQADAITITSSDDSGLGSLQSGVGVKIGSVDIDGGVGTLQVGLAETGATWALPGGVNTAKLAALSGVDITAGTVGAWTTNGAFTGTLTADAIKAMTALAGLGADVEVVCGDATGLKVSGGNMSGDLTVRGSIKTLNVTGAISGDIEVTNGDLLGLAVSNGISGDTSVLRGKTQKANLSGGNFSGTYSTAAGVDSFTVARGAFTGQLSTHGDLKTLKVGGDLGGEVFSAWNIASMTVGSMTNALAAAAGNFTKVTIAGNMFGSAIFSGFDPGSDLAIGGSGDDADTVGGGSIELVTIGGDMGRNGNQYAGCTISAGVGPGADGYVGSTDDLVAGVGTIGKVVVRGGIYGSGSTSEYYGVYAVSNLPAVYYHTKQPFLMNGNAAVGTVNLGIGSLTVTDVSVTNNQFIISFNRPVNSATLSYASTIGLLLSVDETFNPATDINATAYLNEPVYQKDSFSLVLELTSGEWSDLEDTLGGGPYYYQLTLDGTAASVDGDGAIADARGALLDGEFYGQLPSGNNVSGGDFVYTTYLSDRPDNFEDAIHAGLLTLTVDGGTRFIGGTAEGGDTIDIFGFSASAYQFLSAEYLGSTRDAVEMGLFLRDTQGTGNAADDKFELVARFEDMNLSDNADSLFEAFELPETGEYYLALYMPYLEGNTYQIGLTLASSDTKLVDAIGELPAGEQIAYVSNTIGENHNNLGANNPKQLVYLDFNGGDTTKFTSAGERNVHVDALDASELDASLAGQESTLINGNADVTGIVDNMISIFTDLPGTFPGVKPSVQRIDVSNATDWAAYQAASSGLWFTTVDPATARGLDPDTDFTTVFIGRADTRVFLQSGILYGIASNIDVAGQSKADNAIVFVQSFNGYSFGGTAQDRLIEYSRALANVAAHELGHTLGWNHQPTNRSDFLLTADDPDNDEGTPDDSNQGVGLMAYAPREETVTELSQLGTADLAEFPIGQIDTVDLFSRWFA